MEKPGVILFNTFNTLVAINRVKLLMLEVLRWSLIKIVNKALLASLSNQVLPSLPFPAV